MRKESQYSYLCLTLFKQDIEALIGLMQEHLQDVNIIIDNQDISDTAKFEQYASHLAQAAPAYQAQTLVAEGNVPLNQEKTSQEETTTDLPSIRLDIRPQAATLTLTKEAAQSEPAIVAEIRRLLQSRTQKRSQFLVSWVPFLLCVITVLFLYAVDQRYHLKFAVRMLLEIGTGLPLWIITFPLTTFFIRFCHFDTYVFLLPATNQSKNTYGRHEVIETIAAAVLSLILVTIASVVLAHLFMHI